MTKIKFCGLKSSADIEYANILMPEYIGFVFAPGSKRYITPATALTLKNNLNKNITSVGVFANETTEKVAELLNNGIIDIAQLHGNEDEEYVKKLRMLSRKPIIRAFRISCKADIIEAEKSEADFVLLDSKKGGSGISFDWNLVKDVKRDFFLAGGLNTDNVRNAIEEVHPYAADVSSGIEENGVKNFEKMKLFAETVRKTN